MPVISEVNAYQEAQEEEEVRLQFIIMCLPRKSDIIIRVRSLVR